MAEWTVSSEGRSVAHIAADTWTEAFELAAPALLGELRGLRFAATLHADGAATVIPEGIGRPIEIQHRRAASRRRSRGPGALPLLIDNTRYSGGAGPELCVPFGVSGELLEPDAVVPLRCTQAPDQPPIGFEADIDAACARYEAMECTSLGQHAWGAIAIWLAFVDVDAVGLCCTDGESESWLARQGSTHGLCGQALVARIRALARRTGSTWAIHDKVRERAGVVCPLPSPEVGEGRLRAGVLEGWRSGGPLRDWQVEVGMLAATLLSERMEPTAHRERRTG